MNESTCEGVEFVDRTEGEDLEIGKKKMKYPM